MNIEGLEEFASRVLEFLKAAVTRMYPERVKTDSVAKSPVLEEDGRWSYLCLIVELSHYALLTNNHLVLYKLQVTFTEVEFWHNL